MSEHPNVLMINGKIYAFYEIEGDLLYLNMVIEIVKGNSNESENQLMTLISHIENVQFSGMAYLNVNAKG